MSEALDLHDYAIEAAAASRLRYAGRTALYCFAEAGLCEKLPMGYSYAETISADELADLWNVSGVYPDITPERVAARMALERPDESCYIGIRTEDTKRLVGAGSMRLRKASSAFHGNLAVHPDHQGLGLGEAIVRSCTNIADTVDTEMMTVVASTDGLAPLYEAHGFQVVNGPVESCDGISYTMYMRPATQ
jgi:ribosomal protein S18 acetylase RimI-like enzyme